MKRNMICLCIAAVLLLAMAVFCERLMEASGAHEALRNAGGIHLPEEPADGEKGFPAEGVYIRYAVNSQKAGRISGLTLQDVQGQETKEVTAVAKLGYRFVCWSDGNKNPVRKGDTADENRIITAVFDYDRLDLPILSIVTETGKDVQSKTDYINGTLTVLSGEEIYNLDQLPIEIRGRGNYTWGLEKKPYKIKLSEQKSLLGLGKGKSKKWVLLADHADQSLLRNYLSLHLASSMPHIAWSPDCTSVEVYLNGEYRGVYLLVEEVDVNKNKVAVSEDVTGVGEDIGYLIELTSNGKDVVFDAGGKSYQVHNDLSEDKGEARKQFAYIRDYVQMCWDTLNQGEEEEVGRLIDIDSMVDAYLAEEIVKNMDVGWDSFYLYKNAGDRLTFGPLWDFELSLGNANQGVETYDGLYAAYIGGNQTNPWFYTAMNYQWFRRRVLDRWDEIAGLRSGLSAMVVETAQKNYESYCRNFDKWQIFGQSLNRETRQITSLSSYEEHYRFLAKWIDQRLEWMDKCYHEEDFLTGWTGYAAKPNEGESAGEFRGNEEADTLFDSHTRLTVTAASVDVTVPGFNNEEVRNLFDNNTQTKYCASINGTVDITFSLTENASLSGYVFCTANDTSSYSERNPESWVLYGKASDGSWVEVDACSRRTMGLEATDYCCYGRLCAEGTAYTDYKLTVTHDGIIQLGEIVLFGAPLP